MRIPDIAIEFRGVSKDFREGSFYKRALHGIDLEIPRGSIYGLLGPNGAGKSTMINMMSGLFCLGDGEIEVWGMSVRERPLQTKALIGVMAQETNFDPFFTPYEVLELQAGLHGILPFNRKTEEILRQIHLWDKKDSYSRRLSGGMKRRLMMGKAIVADPPILVLDEPTAGVDIELRNQMWEQVQEMNKRGITIVLTTHYLQEAQSLCDRIAIINEGRKITDEDTKTLLSRYSGGCVELTLVDRGGSLEKIRDLDIDIISDERKNREGRVMVRVCHRFQKGDNLSSIIEHFRLMEIESVKSIELDLEGIFLQRIYEDRESDSLREVEREAGGI